MPRETDLIRMLDVIDGYAAAVARAPNGKIEDVAAWLARASKALRVATGPKRNNREVLRVLRGDGGSR